MANIYLHEVLDKWFAKDIQRRLKGRCFLIRYADDFVMGFERKEDAERVLAVLPKRFGWTPVRNMEWTDKPFDWAVRFDQKLKLLIQARDHTALINYPKLGRDAELAIPTNEHYLPMLYALALRGADEPLRFFADKVTMGSISMRAFQIG